MMALICTMNAGTFTVEPMSFESYRAISTSLPTYSLIIVFTTTKIIVIYQHMLGHRDRCHNSRSNPLYNTNLVLLNDKHLETFDS